MKLITTIVLFSIALVGFGQKVKVNLTNALVVGQMDKPQERYAIEGQLSQLLVQYDVKAAPSMNYVKVGGDAGILAEDSLKSKLKSEGIDTYLIVSVRGYDRKFKPSTRKDSLEEKLSQGSLYEIYRQDAVSVTFEFTIYRNGEYLTTDVVKLGNISDRESVLKRFNKKVGKLIYKRWK